LHQIHNVEGTDFKGLFTTVPHVKGSTVLTLHGPVTSSPTRESIHVGSNMHMTDPNGSYVNHSFEPSCVVDGVNLVALKDLPADSEITFNYNENELPMAAPFELNGILVTGRAQELALDSNEDTKTT